MKGARSKLVVMAVLLGGPGPAFAQDTVQVGLAVSPAGTDLPRRVVERLVAYYNDSSTVRLSGRVRVPAQRLIEGNVAVLGGPVELGGSIAGHLVVYNGDVTLGPGARIDGDLTVVGGVVTGAEGAEIAGAVDTYTAVFRYRRTDEGIEYLGSSPPPDRYPPVRRLQLPRWTLGESEIYLSARAYNRIEGLPLALGPRITTGGRNPLRFDALLIYRTVAGFEPEEKDIGYQVRLRQYLGGHRDLWLEGELRSTVEPIESWRLTNLENSLAFFLFRRDYRDYFERTGWLARLGWEWDWFFGSAEFRDERHARLEARTPWTIFFNTDDDYRANAAVEPGELQSVELTLGVDTRTDPERPWQGWYNRLTLERAVGGDVGAGSPDFTHLFLDLRRFTRVSHDAVLALRLAGAGRIGDELLPPQRQHVIGGVGTLPGYDQLEFDCGARADEGFGATPAYGCQRFALFQAEYRTGLDFNLHWNHRQMPDKRELGDAFSIEFDPALVLFYGAGTAWNVDEGFFDHLTNSNNWVADVGAGLDFGGLGLYLAYPLVGSGGFNFFVRLSERF